MYEKVLLFPSDSLKILRYLELLSVKLVGDFFRAWFVTLSYGEAELALRRTAASAIAQPAWIFRRSEAAALHSRWNRRDGPLLRGYIHFGTIFLFSISLTISMPAKGVPSRLAGWVERFFVGTAINVVQVECEQYLSYRE